jgi:energy-converting hydrogenase Eha subunit C
MKSIFININKSLLMEKTILGNIVSVLSLSIAMIASVSDVITILVLLSAFALNITGIIKNLKSKKEQ